MVSLSPELCARIAYFTGSNNLRDLRALNLVSKAFQKGAEPRLYSTLHFRDPRRTILACHSVVNNPRLGPHVHCFGFQQDDRLRNVPVNLGREFWGLIHEALVTMSNLEILHLLDASFSNSWVLDFPTTPFLLKHLDIRFSWDNHMVSFIDSQKELRILHAYDPGDEPIISLVRPESVPNLLVFDGSMTVALQFVTRPNKLARLQLFVDGMGDTPLDQLSRFRYMSKTLRTLNFMKVPAHLSLPILRFVTETYPNLEHLGVFPYTFNEKNEYYKSLMRMNSIQSIEVDVGTWHHLFNFLGGQRALAAEFRTHCPSIIFVGFCFGHQRVIWRWNNGQWHRLDNQVATPYYNLWLYL